MHLSFVHRDLNVNSRSTLLPSTTLQSVPTLLEDEAGSVYIVTLPQGEVGVLLHGLFFRSFATGHLVRYHPSLWFALIARSKGDFTLPLVARGRGRH